MLFFSSAVLISWLFTQTIAVRKTCYAPDGGAPEHAEDYMPCIPVEGVDSMCCALNRTINIDRCLPNGLCSMDGDGGTGGYFRNFCTDKNWKSPNCAPLHDLCITPKGTSELTRCKDGSWCCEKDNFKCCDSNQGKRLRENLYTIPPLNYFNDPVSSVQLDPSSSSTPLTPTASSTLQPTNAAACTTSNISPTQQSIPKSSNKADPKIVGAAVGVSMSVIAITGMFSTYWLGRKQGMKKGTGIATVGDTVKFLQWRGSSSKSMADVKSVVYMERDSGGIHEVPAQVTPAELGVSK